MEVGHRAGASERPHGQRRKNTSARVMRLRRLKTISEIFLVVHFFFDLAVLLFFLSKSGVVWYSVGINPVTALVQIFFITFLFNRAFLLQNWARIWLCVIGAGNVVLGLYLGYRMMQHFGNHPSLSTSILIMNALCMAWGVFVVNTLMRKDIESLFGEASSMYDDLDRQ